MAGRRRDGWHGIAGCAAMALVLGLTSEACASSAGSSPIVSASAPGATALVATNTPTIAPTPTATLPPATPAVPRITPLPGAPDSGLAIQLVAKHEHWSLNALSVPAGKVWHLTVDNEDHNDFHNFVIKATPALPATIFGSSFKGIATMKFDIPGLPAGIYAFLCSVHPQTMTGTLTIK